MGSRGRVGGPCGEEVGRELVQLGRLLGVALLALDGCPKRCVANQVPATAAHASSMSTDACAHITIFNSCGEV